MSKLAVAVLMGGPDAERGISIKSGTAVAEALRNTNEFTVTEVLIDTTTTDELQQMNADVFFPVLHGPYGEGGPLQKLLEQTNIPFVGSDSQSSEIAMNKIRTKEIARSIGIQTPNWQELTHDTPCELAPPLILKPVDDGSSVGMAVCTTNEEVLRTRKQLQISRSLLLAESYIQGREITIGIIDGSPLPIIEIVTSQDIETYDFSAKYERNDTTYIFNPELPESNCVADAVSLYNELCVRDIARVDFMFDDRGAWLLEINTMPGFTDHSLVPMAAHHAGTSMQALCATLVQCAYRRKIK